MASALLSLLLFALSLSADIVVGQEYHGACDKPRNAPLPFCDSSLSFDARVQDLLSRLTLDEKITLLVSNTTGASQNIDLDQYTWWNEGLHGVGGPWPGQGVYFRPPTEFATVFPQIINLAASFNKQLFYEVGNATGNEARAFYNVGNAGLTFWSPDINIYRDPRWGRGHETPGEDPYLSGQYASMFVRGMQGDGMENPPGEGFLKISACCKHLAAYSVESGRASFNSIVTERDMADTYLPAFKTCVQEGGASCVMCSYNGLNGIPACTHKELLTGIVRERWGFDGYVAADCDAIDHILEEFHYTSTPSETCLAVLDAGLDIECFFYVDFFERHLRNAVEDGTVPLQMIDTALLRAYKVLMRAGYFEKDATRPYKDLLPTMVDGLPHQELALEAARQSIVLLKNAPNAKTGRAPLPIEAAEFKAKRASMALIGPHLNQTIDFLGNYNGWPSFIKTPLAEISKYIPDLEFEFGCHLTSFEDSRLQEAEDLSRSSVQVVLFVGLNPQYVEGEGRDRVNIMLPGLQEELIRRVIAVAQEPVILFVVAGGVVDLSEWKDDPRVGAIIWAGYLGQAAGEAIGDVMFGVYNPSGRLTQTFYRKEFTDLVVMDDMNMRPGINGSLGRTYRFYTGEPLYPFGYGLSYTTFAYDLEQLPADPGNSCALQFGLTVRNSGNRAGDHSVLWFLAPPGAGQGGRPIKSLVDFSRVNNVLPFESRLVQLCLNRDNFQLANEEGEFQVVPGEWKLMVGSLERTISVV